MDSDRDPPEEGQKPSEILDLVPATTGQALVRPADTSRSRRYAAGSKAANTRVAYAADWRRFERWCDDHQVQPMPAHPETVAEYLAHCADNGSACASIMRYLTVISQAHLVRGFPTPRSDPRVQAVIQGVRNQLSVAQRQVRPLLLEDLRRIVAALPGRDILKIRNRALLLVGFAGAFRRAELVSLRVDDLQRCERGYLLTLRRSKTDQAGEGTVKGIPLGQTELCPVRAVDEWLAVGGIDGSWLFRCIGNSKKPGYRPLLPGHVAWIVKTACLAAGIDPTHYSGHSLRSGLATQAAQQGASDRAIMKQTGHKSVDMVHRYIRDADIWRDNPAIIAGL